MSDTPDTEANRDHQEMINAVLFKRNLDEVFLLLDFVSGRPDKELSTLTMPNPKGGDPLNAQEILATLAAIRYPAPPGRSAEARAADAAFLLLAKDRLAALAHPARGLTIAYTALFSRSEADGDVRHGCFGWLPRFGNPAPRNPAGSSLRSLAESAFHGLSGQAGRFNCLFKSVIWATIVLLIMTSLIYWEVAVGRATVQRIDQIHQDRAALYRTSPNLTQETTCWTITAENAAGCKRLDELSSAETLAKTDLTHLFPCDNSWRARLMNILHWTNLRCSSASQSSTGQSDDDLPPLEQSIASILSVLSNYVLPMLFGVLGTFVAAIRAVSEKMRDSTLGPRDWWTTLLSVPQGMVAGVAVGLFYSPTGAPMNGSGALAANLTLTTCGLGFIAGYGSQAFLTMLDSLIKKVFPANLDIGDPGTKPTPTPPQPPPAK